MNSVTSAEDVLWLQRARFFLTPVVRPAVSLSRVTGRLGDGNAASILVAGDSPMQRTLLAVLLPGDRREEPLATVAWPRLAALLRREAPRHDLVLALVPQVMVGRNSWPGWLRVPAVVDMRVVADEVHRRRKLGRGTVATAYRRWRQQRFAAVLARDEASFDEFYDTMYLPFAHGRFGEAAFIRDRRSMRGVLGRGGGILWIEQDGRRVAARLVLQDGDTLHAMSVGAAADPDAAEAGGVITATTVASVEHACRLGFRWIDLGGCMPWLTDGVLRNKRRWGAELTHRRWQHKLLLVSWERWNPAAAALLALAPVHRAGNALLAIVAAGPDRGIPHEDLELAGLDGLHIVADSAASGPDLRENAAEEHAQAGLLRPGGSREILAQVEQRVAS